MADLADLHNSTVPIGAACAPPLSAIESPEQEKRGRASAIASPVASGQVSKVPMHGEGYLPARPLETGRPSNDRVHAAGVGLMAQTFGEALALAAISQPPGKTFQNHELFEDWSLLDIKKIAWGVRRRAPWASEEQCEEAVADSLCEVTGKIAAGTIEPRDAVSGLVLHIANWRVRSHTRHPGRTESLDGAIERVGDKFLGSEDLDATVLELRLLRRKIRQLLVDTTLDAEEVARYVGVKNDVVRAVRRRLNKERGRRRSSSRTGIGIKWTCCSIIDGLRQFQDEHGRLPSATEAMRKDRKPYMPPLGVIQNRFGSWNKAMEEAGFGTTEARRPTDKLGVALELKAWHDAHGRWPTQSETDASHDLPSASSVARHFGTNARAKVGEQVEAVRERMEDAEPGLRCGDSYSASQVRAAT